MGLEYTSEKNTEYVKCLLERFRIEYERNDRSGVYGYTQRTMAYNSNRLEGSTLTVEQTATLFDTQTLSADGEIIRSRDIEEMTGHFLMFNHMLKTLEEPLSEELIKKFHYYLKVGVFEDMANGYPCGEYKNRVNTVSDIKVAHPSEVSDKMCEFIAEYNAKKEHSIEDLAVMHAAYESIHPFQDGNGRTGRIIVYRECLKNELIPLIIHDENKAEYQKNLHILQTKGYKDGLCNYFYKEQKDYYDKTFEMIEPCISKEIIQSLHKGNRR